MPRSARLAMPIYGRWAPLLLILPALLALPSWGQQPDAATFFSQNCASCHTIGGGRLVGPDLKDVTQRKDRAWLVRFLPNPQAAIDRGDAYALKLQKEASGIVMPSIPGVDAARANALLDMIEAESKPQRSRFSGAQVSDQPFTPADVAKGRAIFTGAQRLASGGPACISCHTIRGLGGLSGGRLGPDLSLVYERLQGRKGLSGWLANPASPTMAPVFRTRPLQPQEITPLIALFEDSARKGGQDDNASLLNFFLLGLGATVLGLVSLDAIWKKRLRGVRRALLERRERGER